MADAATLGDIPLINTDIQIVSDKLALTDILPQADNVYALGTDLARWAKLYADQIDVGILNSSGLASFDSLSVTNDTNLGTLSTSGLAVLDTLIVTNSTTLSTLTATGHSALATLESSGLAELESLTVTNASNVSTITASGLATLGSAVVNGTTTLNSSVSSNDIYPLVGDTHNLGSATFSWQDVYCNRTIVDKVGVGTTTFDAATTNVVALANGVMPSAGTAGQSYLYAKDVTGTSKLFYMDSDGVEIELGGGFEPQPTIADVEVTEQYEDLRKRFNTLLQSLKDLGLIAMS